MDRLIWLDLEMSGLSPEKHAILEIAVIVTDLQLQWLLEGPNLIVHQSNAVLDAMDDWCTRHHGASGLTAAVQNSKMTCAEAEDRVLKFLNEHVRPGTSPMCGNSIGTDRRFLEQHMPALASYFHYRNLDVSSFKIAHDIWGGDAQPFSKDNTDAHRAMFDVHQSIEEARYYKTLYWGE